jgi:hypothetical protein
MAHSKAILIEYCVSFTNEDFQGGLQSPDQSYDQVKKDIDSSISSGLFDSTLHAVSDNIDSPLVTASTSTPTVVVEAPTTEIVVIVRPTAEPTRTPGPSAVRTTPLPTSPVVAVVKVEKVTTSSVASDLGTVLNVYLITSSTSSTKVAGTLYCKAILTSLASPPKSTEAVVSSGIAVQFSSIASPIDITITDLIPSTSYNLYCHIVSSTGGEGSKFDMLRSAYTFQAACCKELTVTTAPIAIYADTSLYPTGDTSNIFKFQLSWQPGTDVGVSPYLAYANGTALPSNIVVATPATISFKWSDQLASALTGQFFLSGISSLEGDFRLM